MNSVKLFLNTISSLELYDHTYRSQISSVYTINEQRNIDYHQKSHVGQHNNLVTLGESGLILTVHSCALQVWSYLYFKMSHFIQDHPTQTRFFETTMGDRSMKIRFSLKAILKRMMKVTKI